jgi:GGDEF domain-containing protein
VLPNTTHAAALEIAFRISEVVREGAAREAAYPGITIGVATTPADGDQAASLLEAADARLYAQKKHRRATGDAAR